MADLAENFTDEELVTLGMKEPGEPTQKPDSVPVQEKNVGDEKKPDTDPENKDLQSSEEDLGDTSEEKPWTPLADGTEPSEEFQKQFNKVYGKSKHNERNLELSNENLELSNKKLELLRTKGPEEYYKQYPNEKPPEELKAQPVEGQLNPRAGNPGKIPTRQEAGSMKVEGIEGYEGYTLADLYKDDPALASDLYDSHINGIRSVNDAQEKADSEYLTEANKDIENFNTSRAKELYDKPYNELNEAEQTGINEGLKKAVEFTQDLSNKTQNLELAHFALNKNSIIENATKKGADQLSDKLQAPITPSINNGGVDGGELKGYDAYLVLPPGELASRVADMGDEKYKTFIKNAPSELKAKYPNYPWG